LLTSTTLVVGSLQIISASSPEVYLLLYQLPKRKKYAKDQVTRS